VISIDKSCTPNFRPEQRRFVTRTRVNASGECSLIVILVLLHPSRPDAARRSAFDVPENVAVKISGRKTRAVFDRYNIVSTEGVAAAMRLTETSAAKALSPG
jgi:hypothetical protein